MKIKRLLLFSLVVAMFLTSAVSIHAIENVEEPEANLNQEMTLPTEEQILAAEEKTEDMSRLVELLGLSESYQRRNNSIMTDDDMSEAIAIIEKYNNGELPENSILTGNRYLRAPRKQKWLDNMVLVKQSNGYYCGPASAYMVLKAAGAKNITQAILAKSLGTNTAGTGLGDKWPDTLNAYANHYYSIKWAGAYTPIDITDSAIGTLASGYGVVYNTIQYNSDKQKTKPQDRLIGYPSYLASDIYHYVAGYGFDASNPNYRYCYYMDSTNVRDSAYGTHYIPFGTMYTLIKDRGLIF